MNACVRLWALLLISGIGIMATMNITPEIISLIDEIRNDKTHGASQLAREAAGVLKAAAERSQAKSIDEFWEEQKEVGQRLMSARPAMAPLFNIIARLLDAISGKVTAMDLDSVRHLAISRADEVVGDSLQAITRIARNGSELITDGDKIMTHSYSSTVVAMLKAAFTQHQDVEVVTTRSGSGGSGEMTARELGLYGMPVIFIDDTAIGLYLPTVNKVEVGADRICAGGSLVNGIGTYQLALASKKADIPFYVLCETLKFDPRLKGAQVNLEEKEPDEVAEPASLPPETKIKNPYFDITPLELVTAVVTENGLLTAKKLSTIWKDTTMKQA